ncbi:type II toxin-antitoxin system VapB family antitoxin [Microbacterium sp. X-17]|uniref:type II toxin-antitoxin system VapB family antitoxin n=1 Tax=Microbacterium sp. X-17 TaxID=3144404 RepID=UPI0031F520BA
MAITSIDIDPDLLAQAKATTGASSNREAVDIALRRLVAMHRQQAAVERIIAHRFEPDQIDAPTIRPTFIPGTGVDS